MPPRYGAEMRARMQLRDLGRLVERLCLDQEEGAERLARLSA